MTAEVPTPEELAPRPCACGGTMPTPTPGNAMQCADCGAYGLKSSPTGFDAQPPEPAPDPRLVALGEFFRSIGALCRRSIDSTKGRRAYIRMEIKGHHVGHSVEVYPGVRGWYLDHGRRATMVGGKLVDQPITAVKVCARTMLEAVGHGINRLPVAMRAAARGE